ncbi:RDD family protein [Cellulophaga sp. HaHaR_3_176]|uniref:RDD family protein n=1 Tax=Cellulophaga sp. HaHaR_3_176 TaxID=1942464 RepID=UPI001C1F6659|nr:RDD family protein [Cellulophaga sp. HaHaR_3_176]QWX84677.1 RDD family protein [Cellulophaga sp. HaHaR_3_176]
MEQFQIETAQNISINQNSAHLGDRLLAYLLDLLIIIFYVIAILILLSLLDLEIAGRDSWTIQLLLGLPIFLYYLLFEMFNNGKTPGKSALKIRVVKLDGSKPSFSSFFIRWVMRMVDISFSMGGVAVLTILWRGNGQRLGDVAAGTTVVSEKQKISLRDTLVRDIPEGYTPKFPQVTVFKDNEMQTIKNLFESAKRSGDHNVIVSLNIRIKEVTGIVSDMKPIEFVDVVINDFNYYTQQ